MIFKVNDEVELKASRQVFPIKNKFVDFTHHYGDTYKVISVSPNFEYVGLVRLSDGKTIGMAADALQKPGTVQDVNAWKG
jgi:hypothetical protein